MPPLTLSIPLGEGSSQATGAANGEVPPEVQALADRLVRNEPTSFSRIPAGYTYLGQFITHDIVPPTRADENSREVRPRLQLDSLYGDGSGAYFDADGKFIVGEPGWDLWRDGAGKAKVPEPRNDEHVIIAQLHLLWQRLHNQLIEHGFAESPKSARKIVVRLFQMVVVEDFLHRLLDPDVFDACIRRCERHLGFPRGSIPAEFSHAAFRFGHSMVRRSYQLNQPPPDGWPREPTIGELFMQGQPIPKKFRIDWSHFFPMDRNIAQRATRIDTCITPMLGQLPDGMAVDVSRNIAIRDLLAGRAAGLPNGLDYALDLMQGAPGKPQLAGKFGLRPLGNAGVSALGVRISELPLWPYLLLEAEIHQFGDRLGVLGSLIVAETLQNALLAAKPSVLKRGRYGFRAACARMGAFGEFLEQRVYSGMPSDREFPFFEMKHVVELLESLERQNA